MLVTNMGAGVLLILLAIQSSVMSQEDGRSDELQDNSTELLKTDSRRQARQLNLQQDFPVRSYSHTRQVIKVPNNARVKVVHSQQQQHQQPQRSTRGNRINNLNNPPPLSHNLNQNQQYRPRQQQLPQKTRPKRGPFDEDDYNDDEYKFPTKKPRKTKNGYMVQDVSPEEFYEDDEFDVFTKKNKKPFSYAQNHKPTKNKKFRKPEYQYDANPQGSQRRPVYDEDTGYEFNRIRHRDRSPAPVSYYDEGFPYDDYGSPSSITMKQVPPPNLAVNVVEPPHERKESHSVKKQMTPDQYDRYPTEATPVRRPGSNRQMQSALPQHYTTHNPYVTRNLGFEDHERTVFYNDLYDPQDAEPASSENRPVLLPTGSSGIHIVKPPQFSQNVAQPGASVMPPPNQRATIRDILKQDCPDAESLGFCASPPRYPTQQINQVMTKCAAMLDAMYSPAPLETEDDLSSFSSRSDDEDIEFIDTNSSISGNNTVEEWTQWSRSDTEGSNTVCSSLLTQTEPGYAREVASGRWFVIMQTMDAIVQRVMTDTCERPGKPCAGLAGLKCSRGSHSQHGYKATRCVQRHSQQRLISWDPETPHACPKVRIFRFPTACLCHLSSE